MSNKTLNDQFRHLKEKHPDRLFLFRTCDFYVIYNEDAEDAAKILGITLCRKSCDGEHISQAMFPRHALDTYLPKLIRAGRRVAICDQLEDQRKKLTKRGITELVIPMR